MSDQDKGQGRTGSGKPAASQAQRGSKSPGRGSRTSSQYAGTDAPAAEPAPAAAPPPSGPPSQGGAGGAGPEDPADTGAEAQDAFDAAFDLGGTAPVAKPRIDREDEAEGAAEPEKPAPGSKHKLEASPAQEAEEEVEPDGEETNAGRID